ncbi:MAG: sulfate adenylyltransferase subunit CysN [Gammaproteobacteria bacterium]|nr:sulfate adenylyltransferase subunit CysN [Gammaproteobacteria bacterium]
MDLLRFTTAGSVDDGKSTLIGRLLYDAKSIFEDQLQAMERSTERRGGTGVDLSLLTDGLQAEREQGITIDVAYRYFATPKRKFIIADTPGHEQYTRNMVTGASTANLAIVLIDARKGVLTQSRRHAYIAHLLGIPHLIAAINKMDLVDYSEAVYQSIQTDFSAFCQQLGARDVRFIPISALHGDNVVEKSARMPWYTGDTLLDTLEGIHIQHDINLRDFRFPVQLVCSPQISGLPDFRGYMGRIESGCVRAGDDIVVLPSGHRSHIKDIVTYDGNLSVACAPQSVTLMLEDHIDISRGDMIVHPENPPRSAREFHAMLCWMSEQPLHPRGKYLIKHTTHTAKAVVQEIEHKVDINTLATGPASELKMNEIGRVLIKVQRPVVCDAYRDNRASGAFIVIDEHTNNTVAAGMIEGAD